MKTTRPPDGELRAWASGMADEGMLRLTAYESAKSGLEEAAAAYAAAYGDDHTGFLLLAEQAWGSR